MRFTQQLKKRLKLKKTSDGWTIPEVLISAALTSLLVGLVVTVIIFAKNSSESISASGTTQEQLSNSVNVVSDVVSNGRVLSSSSKSLEVKVDNEYHLFVLYDPDNPGIDLTGEWNGVPPETTPTVEKISLLHLFYREGDAYYVIDVLASDLIADPEESGLDLFTFYNENNQIVTHANISDPTKSSRIAIRVVAAPGSHNDRTQELATSVTLRGMSKDPNQVSPGTPDGGGEPEAPASPNAPTIYGTLPVRTQQATIQWADVAGATTYYLYRDGQLQATLPSGGELIYSESRPWGADQTYHVVAESAGGLTAQSNSVTLRVSPQTPQFIGVDVDAACSAGQTVARNLQNCLSWTPRAGATEYRVYHGSTLIYRGTATSIVHATSGGTTNQASAAGLAPKYGDTKTYTVTAENPVLPATAYRGASGGASNHSPLAQLISPPVAPTVNVIINPSATTIRGTSIAAGVRLIEFSNPANAQYYELNRSAPSSVATTWSYSSLPQFPAWDRTRLDLPNNTTFTFRARAGNAAGWGPWGSGSAQASLAAPTVTGQDYQSHPSTRDGHNYFSWTAVTGASDYQWRANTGTRSSPTTTRNSTANAAYGSNTTYRVRACNASVCGPEGTVVLRQGPGPFGVTSYSQTKRAGISEWTGRSQGLQRASVRVNWGVSSAATSYSVQRSGTSLTSSTTSRSFTDNTTSLDSGTKYHYVVTARSSNGLTRQSNTTNRYLRTAPASVDGVEMRSVTQRTSSGAGYMWSGHWRAYSGGSWTAPSGPKGQAQIRPFTIARTTSTAVNTFPYIRSRWENWNGFEYENLNARVDKRDHGRPGTRSHSGPGAFIRTYLAVPSGYTAGSVTEPNRTYDPVYSTSGVNQWSGTLGSGAYSWMYWMATYGSKTTPWNYTSSYRGTGWTPVIYTSANYPSIPTSPSGFPANGRFYQRWYITAR